LLDVKPEQTGRLFNFEGRKHFFGKIPVIILQNVLLSLSLYSIDILKKTADDAAMFCCKLQMSLWTWKKPSDGAKMMKTLSDIGFLNFSISAQLV
jgi:hypothetical protein